MKIENGKVEFTSEEAKRGEPIDHLLRVAKETGDPKKIANALSIAILGHALRLSAEYGINKGEALLSMSGALNLMVAEVADNKQMYRTLVEGIGHSMVHDGACDNCDAQHYDERVEAAHAARKLAGVNDGTVVLRQMTGRAVH